jgi:hypothetical protein
MVVFPFGTTFFPLVVLTKMVFFVSPIMLPLMVSEAVDGFKI